jgi:hypothetical protein
MKDGALMLLTVWERIFLCDHQGQVLEFVGCIGFGNRAINFMGGLGAFEIMHTKYHAGRSYRTIRVRRYSRAGVTEARSVEKYDTVVENLVLEVDFDARDEWPQREAVRVGDSGNATKRAM